MSSGTNLPPKPVYNFLSDLGKHLYLIELYTKIFKDDITGCLTCQNNLAVGWQWGVGNEKEIYETNVCMS